MFNKVHMSSAMVDLVRQKHEFIGLNEEKSTCDSEEFLDKMFSEIYLIISMLNDDNHIKSKHVQKEVFINLLQSVVKLGALRVVIFKMKVGQNVKKLEIDKLEELGDLVGKIVYNIETIAYAFADKLTTKEFSTKIFTFSDKVKEFQDSMQNNIEKLFDPQDHSKKIR